MTSKSTFNTDTTTSTSSSTTTTRLSPNIRNAITVTLVLGSVVAVGLAITRWRRHVAAARAKRVVRIGTRESALAMWQANFVHEQMLQRCDVSDIDLSVLGMTTQGDIDQTTPLTAFTNKGIFTKELDIALLNDRIQLAVHCMKDLPTELPKGLVISATLERGDIEDAVIIHSKYGPDATIESLPAGSIIGTSALRRRAAIARSYHQLKCVDVRGNVNTRLRKLDSGDFDALILAAIGLKRLDLESRINHTLDKDRFGYAVGQGALAIVTRQGDEATANLIACLDHRKTALECQAERGLLRTLEGGCKVPIAVRSTWIGDDLSLWASVSSLDGERVVETTGLQSLSAELAAEGVTQRGGAWELGCRVGRELHESGASIILAELR